MPPPPRYFEQDKDIGNWPYIAVVTPVAFVPDQTKVGADFFDALYQNAIATVDLETHWDGSVEMHVSGPEADFVAADKLRDPGVNRYIRDGKLR